MRARLASSGRTPAKPRRTPQLRGRKDRAAEPSPARVRPKTHVCAWGEQDRLLDVISVPRELQPRNPRGEHLVCERYTRLYHKAQSDPASLTPAELADYVHLLPKVLRREVRSDHIEAAFDAGTLDIHKLAECCMYDLNHAVFDIGASGQLRKAVRLVQHLVKHTKFNQHTFAMLYQACSAQENLHVVLETWRPWAQAGYFGAASVTAMVKCVSNLRPHVALDILVELTRIGCPVPIDVFNQAIQEFGAAGELGSCKYIFSLIEEQDDVRPDVCTYQVMLDAIVSGMHWGLVSALYQHMQSAGLAPDGQLSATFMKAFGYAGEYGRVKEIYESYLQQWSVKPSVWHFNALLISSARNGEWQAVRELLGDMTSMGVKPDAYTAVAVYTAAARHTKVEPEELDEVSLVLTRAGVHDNIYVATAKLNALRTCRHLGLVARCERASQEYAAALDMGLDINAEYMNTLISLYVEADQYARARALYDEMCDRGIMPSMNTYSIMMLMYLQLGRLHEASDFRQLKLAMNRLDCVSDSSSGRGRRVRGYDWQP